MEEFFPHVAKAVTGIVNDLKTKHLGRPGIYARQMNLSISFYGDEEYEAPVVIRELAPVRADEAPLTPAELQPEALFKLAKQTKLSTAQMLAELPTHPNYGGGDIEEEVLSGVTRAAEIIPQDSGQKLLFVVGDMGDKAYWTEKYVKLRKKLVGLLANRDVPIRIVALHVPSRETLSEKGAKVAKLFRDQLQDVINEAAKVAAQRNWPGYAGSSRVIRIPENGDQEKEIVAEITAQYDAWQKEITELEGKLNMVKANALDPSELTPAEKQRLKVNNIDLENNIVRLFREGFVWSHARKTALTNPISGAEQLRSCVLMDKNEIEKINEVLGTFVGIANGTVPAGNAGVGNVIRRVVNTIFGEKDAANSVQEAFEMQWAIPFESDLLKTSYEDLNRGKRFPPKEVMKLDAARGRLLDILAKRNRTWKVEKDASGKYQAVPSTQEGNVVNRGFLREGDPYGLIWYWVRQEELP